MNPKKRPACDLLFPRDRMRKGMVGNNRKAEINVVNVKPQSSKNCEVNRGASGVEEESAAMECLTRLEDLSCVIRDA